MIDMARNYHLYHVF